MRLATRLLALLLFGPGLLLVAEKTPTTQPAPLKYDQLVLTDGRTLQKVVFKSYDPKADKFLLLADGKALSLPAAQIPAAQRPGLRAAAPLAGSSTSTPPPGAVKPVTRITPHPFDNLPEATPAPAIPPAPPSLSAHKNAALSRAGHYYNSEFRAGSNGTYVTNLQFEAGEPEAITGWPNRYRTQGKVSLDWYTGRGTYQRDIRSTFEVITEATDTGVRVLDFTVKS